VKGYKENIDMILVGGGSILLPEKISGVKNSTNRTILPWRTLSALPYQK
jgi:hypothetical protein